MIFYYNFKQIDEESTATIGIAYTELRVNILHFIINYNGLERTLESKSLTIVKL